jgi:anhydro-N-acetylmuramic acid kinase
MEGQLKIIGLMSGTSLDGLDIALVSLSLVDGEQDTFTLLESETVPYPNELKTRIETSTISPISIVTKLDRDLGKFYAESINKFIEKKNIDRNDIDAIACHGQTILHQPSHGFTLQIGNGIVLAMDTKIRVINDFRNHDIHAGGQGAPLVPVGDFGLFSSQSEAFLNLGGFANLSFRDKHQKIRAYDICPVNLPLNKLASNKGLEFDRNGDLARSGELNFFLLDLLNSLDYYSASYPKSLGTEWLDAHFYPLIKFDKDIENNLRTIVEHIAFQIGKQLEQTGATKILVTGGGALNEFLMSRISNYYKGELILPQKEIIEFKEAIIFAYLGALKLRNRVNALSSVTGANCDTVGGVIYDPGY